MSIPRRGYLAAGLAVAMVGTMGFALNAGADEVADAPAPAAAEASADSDDLPPLLPWGAVPEPATAGPAGASSEQLAVIGADTAAPKRQPRGPRTAYGEKGRVSKRTLRARPAEAPPQPPVSAVAAQAATSKDRPWKYHYSAAEQQIESDGAFANVVVGRPKQGKGDDHTLAEIAVMSADERQAVEVGWIVDVERFGDSDPHLFVYSWIDDVPQGYNEKNPGYEPILTAVQKVGNPMTADTAPAMGIQFYKDNWLIAVGSEWIGKFPAKLWQNRFTKAGWNRWFGEVASSTLNPCSEMGTGKDAETDPLNAARFGAISLIGKNEGLVSINLRVTSNYFDETGAERPREGGPAYKGIRVTNRTLRYGGLTPLLPNGKPNPDCG